MSHWIKEEVAREVRAMLDFYRAMAKFPLEPPAPKEDVYKKDTNFYCKTCDSAYCDCNKDETKGKGG